LAWLRDMGYALAREQQRYVGRLVKSGRFNNQSEVVREAIRRGTVVLERRRQIVRRMIAAHGWNALQRSRTWLRPTLDDAVPGEPAWIRNACSP